METVMSLDELAALVADRPDLYIRWSRGPDADKQGTSRDSLTGAVLRSGGVGGRGGGGEAERLVESTDPGEWGMLRRSS